MTKRAPPKGRIKAFAVEPNVTINNQWSHRYSTVEVTGRGRLVRASIRGRRGRVVMSSTVMAGMGGLLLPTCCHKVLAG